MQCGREDRTGVPNAEPIKNEENDSGEIESQVPGNENGINVDSEEEVKYDDGDLWFKERDARNLYNAALEIGWHCST